MIKNETDLKKVVGNLAFGNKIFIAMVPDQFLDGLEI